MSERPESVICPLIRHGSDSLRIIPNPDSKLPLFHLVLAGFYHNICCFIISSDGQHHILTLRRLHHTDKLFLVLHCFAVALQNVVSLLQHIPCR